MTAVRPVLTALVIFASQFTLSAAVSLTLENPGSAIYQQTQNNPCVLGDPSCNNPVGFGYTQFPPGGGSQTYDSTSPTYTVQQIRNIVGNTFFVGIDVNTTTQPLATEKLDYFDLQVNSVVQFVYDPASPGTGLLTVNNGNGFSDALLKGFDLSTFAATDTVTFRAIVNTATDGREEFFLISSTATPVPEPTAVVLFGTVLLGVGVWLRKRVGVNV